jgi:hypothetical protein
MTLDLQTNKRNSSGAKPQTPSLQSHKTLTLAVWSGIVQETIERRMIDASW